MKKNQKVFLLKGLPASGKTTWAIKYVNDHPNTKRVNRDSLRHMLSNYKFSKPNEKMVTQFQDCMVLEILKQGYDLIIDETHLNPNAEKHSKDLVKRHCLEENNDVEIIETNFNIDLQEAIIRDRCREFTVGEKVIRRMYNSYLRVETGNNIPERDINLVDCNIVDVDGTLAIKGNRNAFDFKKVGEDLPNTPIIKLANKLASNVGKVFIFSGRDDSCYEETYKWLQDNGVIFDKLYMRLTKDNRPDYVVKKEMYQEHIEGQFNVHYVIDDRLQVIKMWREDLGLVVLDVAGHDI